MAETVEAVQCFLTDGPFAGKTVLVPLEEGNAPKIIGDEWFVRENPRMFDTANESAPLYVYKYSLLGLCYVFCIKER